MPDLHLHRTQGRVFVDPKRFRVLVAGRRWGKTRLAAAELLSRVPGGGRLWYVAPTYDQARDTLWEELKTFAQPGWLSRRPNESRLELVCRNNAVLQLKSAERPDSLRGRGLRMVVLDEFQDMDPIVWNEILAPSLLDTGGCAMFLGTPKSFNHLYEMFQRGQSTDDKWRDWASYQYKSIDAAKPFGHLDPSLIEMFRETMDPRSFRQELEASFEAMAGRVYYAFDRQLDTRPVQLNPRLALNVSFDFNIDPACALLGQVEGRDVRVWREIHIPHAGGEATIATASEARRLIEQAGFRNTIRIHGDASGKAGKTTGPSDHAVVRQIFPTAVWCIPKDNPHVRDRIAAVNGCTLSMAGQRHLSVDASCIRLIADLEQVTFASNGELDKSNPALTHLSDCLGY